MTYKFSLDVFIFTHIKKRDVTPMSQIKNPIRLFKVLFMADLKPLEWGTLFFLS